MLNNLIAVSILITIITSTYEVFIKENIKRDNPNMMSEVIEEQKTVKMEKPEHVIEKEDPIYINESKKIMITFYRDIIDINSKFEVTIDNDKEEIDRKILNGIIWIKYKISFKNGETKMGWIQE